MIFTDGLSRPEGPALLHDGSWLCVEMGPDRGCVTHISADGRTKRVVARTGRPNGLAVDGEGVVWVAESINPPSLLRMTLDGRFEVFVAECEGEPFRHVSPPVAGLVEPVPDGCVLPCAPRHVVQGHETDELVTRVQNDGE